MEIPLATQARANPRVGKFFGNNAGLDNVGLCAIAAKFFGNRAAGITVFDQQFLPVLGGLAAQVVALGALSALLVKK